MNGESTVTTSNPPRTIGQDLKVPKRRIANASEAMEVANTCKRDNRERSAKLATMKAMVDGEPPYSAAKLRKVGQGYRSNVNPMDAASHLDAAMVPYYDLFGTQRYRVDIETSEGGEIDADRYSRIITEQVDTYLRNDPCFEAEMRSVIYWRVGYGVGTLLWRDAYSPAFCAIRPDKVMVPKMSLASVEKVGFIVIEIEYDVVELYRRIEDEGLAGDAGWNVNQVKRAIADAGSIGFDNYQWDYVRFQQMVKNNEFRTASNFKQVQCARVIWKEFDGTISECLIRMDQNAPSVPGSEGSQESARDFLYVSYGKYDSMGQVLAAFFQDSAEGYWHGATGQMQKTYNVLQLKMRQFNAIQDGAFLRAGPVVRALTPNSNENAQIIQNGALTVLPSSFEVQPSTIMGDLASVMEVSQYNDNTIFSNTGVYRTRMDKPTGNPRTAKEVELQYESAAALSNSAVNRFMSELDVFYRELVRRLLQVPISEIRGDERKKVAELRKSIVEQGVPTSAFGKIFRAEASRGIGNGARYLKQIEVTDVQLITQMLDGRGAKNFVEDFLASRYGYRLAKRWVGEALPTPSDEQNLWEAQAETPMIKDGMNPFVTDDQDNFIHAAEHMRVASDAAQSIQQGADKVAVAAFLHSTGVHVAEHIQRLSTNRLRGAEIKALTQQFMDLSKFTTELEKMIQEEQQQAQVQQQAQDVSQGMDPEIQLKAAKTQADIALKKQKQDATLELKKQKQEFDRQSRIENTKFNQALKDATTAHGIIDQNVKTQADVELARRKQAATAAGNAGNTTAA